MTDLHLEPADGDPMSPSERLDLALTQISQATNEIVVAYKEFDRLASRWSVLEAVTASPRDPTLN